MQLQLWDTSGLERFRSITTSYYRNARALIVVYDMSWYRSFENLASWLAEIERYADQPMLTVLVGKRYFVKVEKWKSNRLAISTSSNRTRFLLRQSLPRDSLF